MRKILLIAIASISIITEICPSQQLTQLPSLVAIQEELHNDYKTYLKNELETYKKGSSIDARVLIEKGKFVLCIDVGSVEVPSDNIVSSIMSIVDENGNNFIHLAVEKNDVDNVNRFACMRTRILLLRNNAGDTALDLCIKKLQSDMSNNRQSSAMLEYVLQRTALISRISDSHKQHLEESLKKVMRLQLLYKKHSKTLNIPLGLLAKIIDIHITEDKYESAVAPFYQHISDEVDGNTFTHTFVGLGLADELYEWVQKGRISFDKNNKGETPIDIALSLFRTYTQNPVLIDSDKRISQRRRCCLFILLNYLLKTTQQKFLVSLQSCCPAHSTDTKSHNYV